MIYKQPESTQVKLLGFDCVIKESMVPYVLQECNVKCQAGSSHVKSLAFPCNSTGCIVATGSADGQASALPTATIPKVHVDFLSSRFGMFL